ncbi:hypothetical protein SFC88_00010 [Nocardioides sp. HM23]|uniref:hypothetical protein n=1 Tax=Nocardioides bizhenqiangii TaxID=3095076 RepID=UPI002ACA98C1|nr:hypothetical protein [Nocardioides sp. HM23]MDZ5619184.1 hypothetical protein [Nocardioides sp. HM23]
MASNRTLLSIIGSLNPAAYDALFPHGPVISQGIRFGRSLAQLAFVADKLDVAVRPMAQWTDPGDFRDDLGDDSAIAALVAKLLQGGVPAPDDEPKPHYRNELLAGVALGIASAGALVDRNPFLSEVFDAVVGGITDVRSTRSAAA